MGNAAGRSFQGTHGDGVLDATGDATGNGDWPTDTTGFRGGAWSRTADFMRTSDRTMAGDAGAARWGDYGWRGVRSAP